MQSDAALADQRAALEEERVTLSQRLAELGFGGSGSLTFDQNFADSSQVTAGRGGAGALAASLREALGEVERALVKLDQGGYAMCEACAKPINPARLEAMPAARLCIDCASQR